MNVTPLSFTVQNLSGIISTVGNLLSNVSLSTSLISADVLNINLSVTNCSTRCKKIENTQNNTVIPTLNTLTTTSGYSSACCVNVSNLCSTLISNDASIFNSIAVINWLIWSVSNTVGLLGTDNSSFKSVFANVNSSIFNAEASLSSLFQRNSDITSMNNSVVNSSLKFTPLPAALTKLSTPYWIDNTRLTQNINKLTSLSTVAYNAWNAFYLVMTR